MALFPNPVRLTILWIGLGLARLGLIDRERARRTVELAWPRVVTGLARMSKNAADVAMVGIGVGPAAIAGVGFAGPYWGTAFTIGAGLAAGTIALVSQRFGADAIDELEQAVRTSVVAVLALTIPVTLLFWSVPTALIGLLTTDPATIGHGSTYLRLVALGVPLAGLNLVWSRVLIGADDAWIPMVIRAGGAVVNIVLNAVFIFGLGYGVAGAAYGTVVANLVVSVAFLVGLRAGRLPGIGAFPVSIAFGGRYLDRATLRDLFRIAIPVIGRNGVWTGSRFPMLAFVGLFGQQVVAAYVISRRIWGLMTTPGWGFGLAAGSLVGQSLGAGDESVADRYGREIVRLSVATHVVTAGIVFLLARPIVGLFVGDATDPTIDIAVPLVYAACLAVIGRGVSGTMAGALDAAGDTTWPFYGRFLGMVVFAIPLTYLGATTGLGLMGLYLAYLAQTYVPAAVNYYRYSTGAWISISRGYRPSTTAGGDRSN